MASNNLKALSWVLLASALTLLAQLQDAAAQSPTPSTALAVSANTTGSLGNLCSSQPGVLSLIQAAAANQDSAGLGVVVPANLTNAAALQEIAQVRRRKTSKVHKCILCGSPTATTRLAYTQVV